VTYFHGGLQIPFDVSRQATPYIVVSAGIANLDPVVQGVSPDNRFSASGGIGVKVPVNRNLGLRLEARGYFTSLAATVVRAATTATTTISIRARRISECSSSFRRLAFGG